MTNSILQNDYYDGSLECPSEKFLKMALHVVTPWQLYSVPACSTGLSVEWSSLQQSSWELYEAFSKGMMKKLKHSKIVTSRARSPSEKYAFLLQPFL